MKVSCRTYSHAKLLDNILDALKKYWTMLNRYFGGSEKLDFADSVEAMYVTAASIVDMFRCVWCIPELIQWNWKSKATTKQFKDVKFYAEDCFQLIESCFHAFHRKALKSSAFTGSVYRRLSFTFSVSVQGYVENWYVILQSPPFFKLNRYEYMPKYCVKHPICAKGFPSIWVHCLLRDRYTSFPVMVKPRRSFTTSSIRSSWI